jgi:hypothetical protein
MRILSVLVFLFFYATESVIHYKHVITCHEFTRFYKPIGINSKISLTKDELNFYVNQLKIENIWTKITHPTMDMYYKILPGFIDDPKNNAEWIGLQYRYIITKHEINHNVAVVFSSNVTKMKENKVCTR